MLNSSLQLQSKTHLKFVSVYPRTPSTRSSIMNWWNARCQQKKKVTMMRKQEKEAKAKTTKKSKIASKMKNSMKFSALVSRRKDVMTHVLLSLKIRFQSATASPFQISLPSTIMEKTRTAKQLKTIIHQLNLFSTFMALSMVSMELATIK